MSEFIEWLEEANQKDSRVRAVLRRSLSFDPGCYPPAYPYVEWRLKEEENAWRRAAYYLAAGLWGQHFREDRNDERMPIGKACAAHQQASGSTSTERRFISLLDSDPDQLPHRLRHMVSLLKDHNLDFESLLKGLLYWNDDQKRTQNAWARDFYRQLDNETKTDLAIKEAVR